MRLLRLHVLLGNAFTDQARFWLTSATYELAGTHVIPMNFPWQQEGGEAPDFSSDCRYPTTLMAEYRALGGRELNGLLTPDENARFGDVRARINAIDRNRPHPDTWDMQRVRLREELNQIRAEVEALPDAE